MNGYQFLKLLWIIFKTDRPNLKTIENMGLLAVKIGQLYALRIDFLNEETCQHLSQLYRQNNPLPSEEFKKLFEEYAPKQLKEQIQEIENQPIATASVGQVHKATLKDGRSIAIKIIKAQAKEQFLDDVKKLKRFIKIILFFYPKLKRVADPLGTLKQIESDTLAELNLLNEIAGARTLSQIKKNYQDRFDLSRVEYLHCYEELSNENVLVSDFVEGITFDELLSEKALPYEDLLELFRIHGLYLFIEGTFHGDIHPGNIIFHNKNLLFLDTSSISHVQGSFGLQLLEMFGEMQQARFKECAHLLHSISKVTLSEKRYATFEKDFLELYKDFPGSTVSEVSLTTKMMQTVKLAVHAGMDFESGMFSVIKSLMYLDGMVIKCKPDAVLLDDMKPFMEAFKAARIQ